MEEISELITKKKLEVNNKIKEILILKNKNIILLYDNKLELYKSSLIKYIEIHPEQLDIPIIFEHFFELKSKKNFIIIAITTNISYIYIYIIKNNTFQKIQKLQGDIICKLNNNKFIKFFKNKYNSYTYTLYKNKNESKYNKIRDNIITFKSYFEKEEKLIDNLYGKKKSFIKNFDYNNFKYNLVKLKCNTDEIKIIKLFKISEKNIIIITRENHEQTYGVEHDYDIIFKKYYYVYNVILFDINFEIKNLLYSKKYLYNLKDNLYIHEINDDEIIYSFDVNIINDNLLYINMYYSTNCYKNEILNEFIIYNINRREFKIYELPFKPFEIWENYNYLLTYKNNSNFYLLFDSELKEFKVTKDGIEEIFYCNFNWKNDTSSKYFFKFQDKIFYIITNNYFYILKLK